MLIQIFLKTLSLVNNLFASLICQANFQHYYYISEILYATNGAQGCSTESLLASDIISQFVLFLFLNLVN